MVVWWYISIPMLKLYIRLCIWRCDGPERHEMLTVFDAYYGYCEILQICQICQICQINPLIQMQ